MFPSRRRSRPCDRDGERGSERRACRIVAISPRRKQLRIRASRSRKGTTGQRGIRMSAPDDEPPPGSTIRHGPAGLAGWSPDANASHHDDAVKLPSKTAGFLPGSPPGREWAFAGPARAWRWIVCDHDPAHHTRRRLSAIRPVLPASRSRPEHGRPAASQLRRSGWRMSRS
jgi:hypothetical protein